jgi:hypothetical protein
MSQTAEIKSSSRRLSPEKVTLLRSLKTGDRIKLTQTVRVGSRKWTTETKGVFRGINYLATGVTTERIPEDDVIVPTVHFTKENGELSSIAIDENTKIEMVN